MRIDQTYQSLALQKSTVSKPNKEDAALRKSCNEFESLLVGQVLKQMRQTVQKSDVFGSSEQEDTFQGMLDDEMTKSMSSNHSLGIADVMYKQLSRQNNAQVPEKTVEI